MKKALCVLLSVVMLLSMSVTAFAADTKGAPSQTLPSWLPDDAPAPDPNSEISIVHFYINEDGETIVYDPETEVIPYSTAYGDAGTAAIYWVISAVLSEHPCVILHCTKHHLRVLCKIGIDCYAITCDTKMYPVRLYINFSLSFL